MNDTTEDRGMMHFACHTNRYYHDFHRFLVNFVLYLEWGVLAGRIQLLLTVVILHPKTGLIISIFDLDKVSILFQVTQ